ncbi:Protein of unknown function [Sulfitobacter marinus]|uniref:DUF3800 domain-containing protein n=1 Tax=Sulfitobacter marinus TaxID=394264 RepID=A0A1I6VPD4_9RHOB|nr:DUF3800 domain-containing protein [Sulfitobacter marinus]SFT15294.1 Protein of unknown function [Sulfitobacter marinus]
MQRQSTLYVFLDEGGDLNFSSTGSKFFTLTCVSLCRPFLLHTKLDTYKYDLIEFWKEPRIDLEYFHCADDNRFVRERVFSLLAEELPRKSVDAVVIEKSKTGPSLRAEEKFYPKMLGYLLRYALEQCPSDVAEVVVITDAIPINRKRRAIEKSIKQTLKSMLPKKTPYRIMHHASRAHYGLQLADYLNWSILRKWEKGEDETYKKISHLVRSEFEIFRTGVRHYYDK